MLDQEDLKWVASTSTSLNSILQQISRYTDLARRHKGEHNYLDLLGDRVDLGSKTAQALFDRITSTILAHTAAKSATPTPPPTFTVMPPPVRAVPPRAAEATPAFSAGKPTSSEAGNPTVQPTTAAKTGISPEITVKNPKGNRELVLLIEDDFEVADLAAEMLIEEGYKLILARDGFEALEIYQRIGKQIGLVILDFFLPVMDGDAVFDELRALNPNINVVLSSGFAEQDKIGAMLAQGLRGFIPKPYSREKLLAQVRSTLDAGRQGLR